MSRAGWPPSGAARPPALVPPPTADSIAYRRYLRYLPEYRARRREEEPRGAQKSGEQRQDDDDDEGEEKDCGEKSVEGEKEGGDGAILVSPDVSVSSLVQQYTNMLHARNTSSDAPYNFSRSCSNLPTQCRRPSASLSGGTPPDGEQPRKGSLHCRSGAPNQVRCRSLSLPWPSESSWRWHSEPGLACQDQASGVAVSDAAPPHAASLANLDSATSDEGCPGDDVSTGPSPLPSPDCSVAHRLSGLITPFRSLSPASSVGSHLGSVEDLPLVRSMSAGHVLDSLRRSHSADSAVEVEDEATSPMGSPLNDDPGVAEDSCEVPDEPGEGEDEGQVFCECPATNFAEVNGDGDDKSDEHRVTLRLKSGDGRRSGFSERRRGEVNGDALLRLMRGCGVVGCGQRQQAREGGVLRTPSVVISDYSGDTVSLTVALASSDFSLSHLDGLQHSASSPSLIPPADDFSSRKVSSCSSCSSVSTVDFTTPLTFTPLLRRTHSPVEESHNRISTTSTYSYLSNSEDEVEHVLTRPQTPRKPSNWRKVRNIVQWTPFIQTYKKHKYPWVQLAGHQGNFRAGLKQGTILKKLCPPEEKALEAIMKDVLRPYVPRYSGVVEGADGEKYLQMEDLLSSYSLPCVMDIKMGVRTYLEDELAKAREKPKLRKDMYEKMIQIDPKAPTEAENRAKAVTKPRYMVWRETISSTATLGFRIEGVRRGDGTSSKDFKTTRTREQVLACLTSFLQGYPHVVSRYVQQLKSIKVTLEGSSFFKTHELIGSSLLFVHNDSSALVRMIDFAKTVPLPQGVAITHRSPWSEGTHEDGYLLGLENLIDIFTALEKVPLPTPNGTITTSKPATAATDTAAPASPPAPATVPTPAPAPSPQQLPDGGGDEVKVVTAELTPLTISSVSTTTTTTSTSTTSTSTTSTSEHHHRPLHLLHHPPNPPPIAPVSAPTPAPPT